MSDIVSQPWFWPAVIVSVGLPLDMLVIERDTFAPTHQKRIEASDAYFQLVSASWSDALRDAFHSLPDYSFYREAEPKVGKSS